MAVTGRRWSLWGVLCVCLVVLGRTSDAAEVKKVGGVAAAPRAAAAAAAVPQEVEEVAKAAAAAGAGDEADDDAQMDPKTRFRRRCLNALAPPALQLDSTVGPEESKFCSSFAEQQPDVAQQLIKIALQAAYEEVRDFNVARYQKAMAQETPAADGETEDPDENQDKPQDPEADRKPLRTVIKPRLGAIERAERQRTAVAVGLTNLLEAAAALHNPGKASAKWPSQQLPDGRTVTRIPYVIEEETFTRPASKDYRPEDAALTRQSIDWAINHIEAFTCVRLVYYKRMVENTVRFAYHEGVCQTQFSFEQKPITVRIHMDRYCYVRGGVHEIMHAMGFGHTQNRLDRDKYVQIHFKNIPRDVKSQYQKVKGKGWLDYGVYDFESVMHYGATFDKKTIISAKPLPDGAVPPIGTIDVADTFGQMSNTDAAGINTVYCPGIEPRRHLRLSRSAREDPRTLNPPRNAAPTPADVSSAVLEAGFCFTRKTGVTKTTYFGGADLYTGCERNMFGPCGKDKSCRKVAGKCQGAGERCMCTSGLFSSCLCLKPAGVNQHCLVTAKM